MPNIDTSDSVALYDLTNQEINYWITVSDSVTVKLAVLPQVIETVTIVESIIPRLVVQPQLDESLTIAESVTLAGALSLSQFDSVSGADAVTPSLLIQPNRFESVTVAEAITLSGSTSLTAFDAVSVAELASAFLPKLNVTSTDDVAAAESVNISLGLITTLFVNSFDSAATTESVTVLLPTLKLDQSDTATIAESITLLLPTIPASTFESVTANEFAAALLAKLNVTASDNITAAESVFISLGVASILFVDLFDSATAAESVSVLLPSLNVNQNDSATIAESVTAVLPVLPANTFESVSVAEQVVSLEPFLTTTQSEAVLAAEAIIALLPKLVVSSNDIISVAELAIGSVVFPQPALAVTVVDTVTLGDAHAIAGTFLWVSVGSLGSAGSKSANQASLTLVTTSTLDVGNFAVVLIAVDNNQTTDGNENAVTSLVDSAGNAYLEAVEFTNGQGAAQGGATVSIWYCKATAQLNSGGTITASFSNATSRDASAISAFEFSTAIGGSISLAGSVTLANDNADPGSVDLTLSSGEYLWVRAQAHERPSTDVFTKTVAYGGIFDKNGTTGGTAATNMTVAGEWDFSVGTSNASNPAWSAAADEASALVAFRLDSALAPSLADSIALTEVAALLLPRLVINSNEPVTTQELITIELGGIVANIPVSTSESLTLTEALQVTLARLTISVTEDITSAEFIDINLAVQTLFIELGEDVATTENIVFRGRLSISVSDLVLLLGQAPNVIAVVEDLTVTDFSNLFGATTIGLSVAVFENVVVDIPETSVFESIAVSELAQVAGTGIDWFSIGSLGSISSNSADQSSIVLQAGAVAEVGNVVVVLIAVDNAATSDGDEGAITGVTDAAGNTWVEIGEFTNANAAPQAGATISAWYSLISTQIALNSLITATFSNPSSRDASALTAWEFGRRNSGAVTVAAVTTLANDNSDPGSMNLSLGAGEHLWVRAQAHEGPLSDVWIKTIPYDGIFDKQGTTGGLAASNMTVAAEFRIFQGASNPSDPSWTAAADEAGMLFALKLSANLAPIAADSVTIAELASLALARLTVNVNDTLNVLEAVTLKQTANLSVFETVSVPDFSALIISVQPTGFDAVALTESIALASQMSIISSDTVTVADAVVMSTAVNLTLFDVVTITDVASVPIPILLSTADTVTLAEATTVFLPKLVLSIFDTVTALDVSALFVQGTAPAPAAGDFVDAEDDATVSLNRLTLNTFDAVTAAESVTLTSQMSLTANDAVTVAEAVTPRLSVYLSSFDAVTLADTSVLVLTIPVIAFESVSVAEVATLTSKMSLSASDNVTVAEQGIVTSRALIIDLQDNVTISDVAASAMSLRISQNDALVLADSTAAVFTVQTIFIEQGDTVATQEEIDQEIRGDVALAIELVSVDDFANLSLGKLIVAASEDIAAQEDLTGRLSCYVSLAESVSVADAASYIFHGQTLTINLGEAITVSDAFSTNLSLLKIVDVTSEIALEMNMQSGIATDLVLTSEINNDIDLEGEIEL